MCGCGSEESFEPRVEAMNITGLPGVPAKAKVEEGDDDQIVIFLGEKEKIEVYFGFVSKGEERVFLVPSLLEAFKSNKAEAAYPGGQMESLKVEQEDGHEVMTFAGKKVVVLPAEEGNNLVDLAEEYEEEVRSMFFPD